jgi:hypothetical protein
VRITEEIFERKRYNTLSQTLEYPVCTVGYGGWKSYNFQVGHQDIPEERSISA